MSKDSPAPKADPPVAAEQPEKKRSLQQRADAGEALTIAECAQLAGNTKVRRLRSFGEQNPTVPPFNARHAAAAQAHGWNEHRLHSAEPLELKFEDYKRAIEVTCSSTKRGGEVHAPAVSRFAAQARKLRKAKAAGKAKAR